MRNKTPTKRDKDSCKRKNTKDSTCVKKLKTSKDPPPQNKEVTRKQTTTPPLVNKENIIEQRKQKLKDLTRRNSTHAETRKSPKAQAKVKVM